MKKNKEGNFRTFWFKYSDYDSFILKVLNKKKKRIEEELDIQD